MWGRRRQGRVPTPYFPPTESEASYSGRGGYSRSGSGYGYGHGYDDDDGYDGGYDGYSEGKSSSLEVFNSQIDEWSDPDGLPHRTAGAKEAPTEVVESVVTSRPYLVLATALLLLACLVFTLVALFLRGWVNIDLRLLAEAGDGGSVPPGGGIASPPPPSPPPPSLLISTSTSSSATASSTSSSSSSSGGGGGGSSGGEQLVLAYSVNIRFGLAQYSIDSTWANRKVVKPLAGAGDSLPLDEMMPDPSKSAMSIDGLRTGGGIAFVLGCVAVVANVGALLLVGYLARRVTPTRMANMLTPQRPLTAYAACLCLLAGMCQLAALIVYVALARDDIDPTSGTFGAGMACAAAALVGYFGACMLLILLTLVQRKKTGRASVEW